MNNLKVTALLLIIIFSIFSIIDAGVNECLHAWNERVGKPEQCKESADCQGERARCVFSPVASRYICCGPKKNGIQPECPGGMSLRLLGKNSEVIICDKSGSAAVEEQCPYGFECVESVTNFTKNIGQSNQVCCVR